MLQQGLLPAVIAIIDYLIGCFFAIIRAIIISPSGVAGLFS